MNKHQPNTLVAHKKHDTEDVNLAVTHTKDKRFNPNLTASFCFSVPCWVKGCAPLSPGTAREGFLISKIFSSVTSH